MKGCVLLIIVLGTCAIAQVKLISGKVTYIAGGTVYTSLGRANGVEDSSNVVVLSGSDTLAQLKVFAVSSQSSACRIVSSRGTIAIGNVVAASVVIVPRRLSPTDTTTGRLPSMSARKDTAGFRAATMQAASTPDLIAVRGRISAQYYSAQYGVSNFNSSQPGVVVSLRGNLRELPVKFELYGNFRSLSYGGVSPFSGGSINQSRIYRLSVEYDDGANTLSLGRIVPSVVPSVGYIDGAMVSHQFGNVLVGSAFGFQPAYSLWGVETGFKKFAIFTAYREGEKQNILLSSAYSRTYYLTHLDREVATAQLNVFTSGGFFLFANSEVDLRTKSGSELLLHPSLTTMYLNLSYRLTDAFSVGVGADASRPFYTYSSVLGVPDSLLDRQLRSGVNVNLTLSLPGGLALNETFAPRNSDAAFGREYSNIASFSYADVLSSGITVRTNMNHNASAYTDARGYGFALQRNFWSTIDFGLRYQQYDYTVSQINQHYLNRTLGGDLLVSLTRALTFMLSYERLDGGGQNTRSLFAEFGVRF